MGALYFVLRKSPCMNSQKPHQIAGKVPLRVTQLYFLNYHPTRRAAATVRHYRMIKYAIISLFEHNVLDTTVATKLP